MQKSLALEPPRLWMDCLAVCPWRFNICELSSRSKIMKYPNIMVKTNYAEKTSYELDVLKPVSCQNPPRPQIACLAHALIQVFTLSTNLTRFDTKGKICQLKGKKQNVVLILMRLNILTVSTTNFAKILLTWSNYSTSFEVIYQFGQAIASVKMKNGKGKIHGTSHLPYLENMIVVCLCKKLSNPRIQRCPKSTVILPACFWLPSGSTNSWAFQESKNVVLIATN